MKVTQADGTEIEVFTADEVAVKTKEVETRFTTQLTEKENALKVANEALAKAGDKDQNFKALREAKEEAEKNLATLRTEVDGKIKGIENKAIQSALEKNVKVLAGGDAELEKKIRHHYDRIVDPATTDEEVAKKTRDAYLLATRFEPKISVLDNINNAGGYPTPGGASGGAAKEFSPELKQLGGKLGLSEDDLKKFGKK